MSSKSKTRTNTLKPPSEPNADDLFANDDHSSAQNHDSSAKIPSSSAQSRRASASTAPQSFAPNALATPELPFDFSEDDFTNGRDDLNLIEFPICSIYHVRDPDIKTLVYFDKIKDASTGQIIDRKLTVTSSDEFGLPSYIDEEVLLGMIQMAKMDGFRSRKVPFSKYRLIKILGWQDHSHHYRRIEESMNRWLNVGLTYDNAWRNKESGTWDSEGFHIIDNFKLSEGPEGSFFLWNEVIFRDLKIGNLKALDFSIYNRLKTPIAKRMYRFLDKRFYHKKELEFDLLDFAHNKIGVAKNQPASVIKQRIHKAILELEAVGFIKKIRKDRRYKKVPYQRGAWRICFEKNSNFQPATDTLTIDEPAVEIIEPNQTSSQNQIKKSTTQKAPKSTKKSTQTNTTSAPTILTELQARGIAPALARRLAASHEHDFIARKIEHLNHLITLQNTGKRARSAPIENPTGLLIHLIENQTPDPENFQTKNEKIAEKNQKNQQIQQKITQEQTTEAEHQAAEAEAANRLNELHAVLSNHLAPLSAANRHAFLTAALAPIAAASPTLLATISRGISKPNSIGAYQLQLVLLTHIFANLDIQFSENDLYTTNPKITPQQLQQKIQKQPNWHQPSTNPTHPQPTPANQTQINQIIEIFEQTIE